MNRYALIQGGIVANVVEQDDTPQIAGEWVACGDAGPGWAFDGAVFAPPSIPEPVAENRNISVGAFFDRFGAQKYPILMSLNPGVQALIKDCTVRTSINLDSPQLPYGLAMIVAAGFTIDSAAIINDPILPGELP